MDLNSVFMQFFDYQPDYYYEGRKQFFDDEFSKDYDHAEIAVDNYYQPKTKLVNNIQRVGTDDKKPQVVDCKQIEELLDRLSLGRLNSTIDSELKFLLDNIDDTFEPLTTVSAPKSVTSVTNFSFKNINQESFLGFTKVLTPIPIPLIKNYELDPQAKQLLMSIGSNKICIVSSLGQSQVGKSFLSNILLSRPIRRRFPLSQNNKLDNKLDNDSNVINNIPHDDEVQAFIFLAEYDSQSTVYGFIDWKGQVDAYQIRVATFISDTILFHHNHENTECINNFLNTISEMVSKGCIGDDSSGVQDFQPLPLIKVVVHDSPKYSLTSGSFKQLDNYAMITLPFPLDETLESPSNKERNNNNNKPDPSLYPPHSYSVDFINACEELKKILFVHTLEKSKSNLPKNGNILQCALDCFNHTSGNFAKDDKTSASDNHTKAPDSSETERLKNVWKMARNAHDESLRFQCKEIFLKYIRQDLQPLLPVGTKHLLEICYEYKIHVIDHHKKNVMGDEQKSLEELSQKIDKIIKKAIKENEEFAEKANLNKLQEISKRFTDINDIKNEYDKNIQGPTSIHYKTFREFESGFNL